MGIVGVLSVLSGLAGGHLVAGLVDRDSSPLLAVGNAVRDATPYSVTKVVIGLVGTYDKLLLFGGVLLVLTAVGVGAGLLARRRPWPGILAALLLGGIGLVVVLTRPGVGAAGVVAPLVTTLVGAGTFALLWRLATRARRSGGEASPVSSRRRFLLTSVGVGVGAGLLGAGGEMLARRAGVEASRAAIGPIIPTVPAPPIPPGADFVEAGTPPFLTPLGEFYRVDTALTVPRLRAEDWRLRVHGMVDRELRLTYDDIRSRALVERTVTLTCVSNEVGGPYVSTANFTGVPLRELLLEAGVRPGADQLFSISVDRWTAGTPMDVVLEADRGAMLAIGMNGRPLPLERGFPARLVVPGLYGFVSATKWVVDLEVTTFAERRSYWLQRGWGRVAPIKTQSRIDAPRPLTTVPAGRVTLAGVSWAQPVGIRRVEVRVDGGPWMEAELSTEVSGQTWRMWRLTLPLEPGPRLAEVRATDQTGMTQPEERVAPIPDGATGWHSIQFTVA